MRNSIRLAALVLALSAPSSAAAQAVDAPRHSANVSVAEVTVDNRSAVRVTHNNDQTNAQGVVLTGHELRDGVIEVELKSELSPGAPEGSRGFVGLAFRVQPDLETYEAIYIRPTNGRADDQLRRNRSTQYVSHPLFPWFRLRQEAPGQYESYVDLELGAWTRLRIEIEGTRARLYVNDAPQPALVVNDLKHGGTRGGAVAFWVGSGTIAHFANLRVTARE